MRIMRKNFRSFSVFTQDVNVISWTRVREGDVEENGDIKDEIVNNLRSKCGKM